MQAPHSLVYFVQVLLDAASAGLVRMYLKRDCSAPSSGKHQASSTIAASVCTGCLTRMTRIPFTTWLQCAQAGKEQAPWSLAFFVHTLLDTACAWKSWLQCARLREGAGTTIAGAGRANFSWRRLRRSDQLPLGSVFAVRPVLERSKHLNRWYCSRMPCLTPHA